MASYRKRGATWRAEVAKAGIRDSATFDTKAEAVAWATKLEAEIDAGRRRSYSKVQKTVSDAFDEYLEKVSPNLAKHKWNETRLEFLRGELDFVGTLVRNVKPEQIAAWRDKRLQVVKPSTVNRDLNLLSAVFQAAHDEWKWIHGNPVREVTRPKDPPPRRRRAPDRDAAIMCSALGLTEDGPVETTQQYTAIAFLFAIETGMRQGEIIGTTWPNVHIDKRYVHVPTSKNGDARDVPLSKRAIELLGRLPRIKGESRCFPVSQGSVDALWRKVRGKVAKKHPEMADLNFHDSRHEATTRLSRKLSVLALAKMIGHRDIQSLMIYYDETAAELAARLD
ncbi:site-specific integrase [Burkholderia metallica]|uniref:tyrosine-type recombinase/integrase n=1 Tax=Burkholderia metallica TaxID=488729 RepID=UPI00157A6199|nr:site-specific integrase [Burkholderia metallica]NTZ84393.1 site-specific integrase [Burkholderia metallica]